MELKGWYASRFSPSNMRWRIHYMELKGWGSSRTDMIYQRHESITWSWKLNSSFSSSGSLPVARIHYMELKVISKLGKSGTLINASRIHYMELKVQDVLHLKRVAWRIHYMELKGRGVLVVRVLDLYCGRIHYMELKDTLSPPNNPRRLTQNPLHGVESLYRASTGARPAQNPLHGVERITTLSFILSPLAKRIHYMELKVVSCLSWCGIG